MSDARARAVGLAVLLVLAVMAPASGQAGPPGAPGDGRNGLAFGVGGLWQGLADRAASPLHYRGGGASIGVLWERDARAWRWTARGAGAYTRLESRLTNAAGGFEDAAWLSASVRAVRPVWEPLPHATVWVGPAASLEGGIRRHLYTSSDWLIFNDAFLALQAAALATLDLARWGELSASLALPVLGVAARKAYPGAQGHPPAVTLGAPPRFVLARHELGYRARLRGPAVVRAFHEAVWVRHPEPRFDAVSHRVGLALEWDLGWSP